MKSQDFPSSAGRHAGALGTGTPQELPKKRLYLIVGLMG
jgi:hypothetical protein